MGFRIHMIAVTGKPPHTIQQELGVTPTGTHIETPDDPVQGAVLNNGAYLLYFNERETSAPDDRTFRRLSRNASLLACYINETCMFSSVSAWSNGVELWSVYHDAGCQGIEHLETAGKTPPELEPIRENLLKRQREEGGCDYIFDIPADLFAALGGIKYCEDIPGVTPDFWEVLQPIKKPWWKFW